MLYMQHAEDGGEILSVSLALIAALVVVYVAMRFGRGIARLLKDDGIDLVSVLWDSSSLRSRCRLVATGIASWIEVFELLPVFDWGTKTLVVTSAKARSRTRREPAALLGGRIGPSIRGVSRQTAPCRSGRPSISPHTRGR